VGHRIIVAILFSILGLSFFAQAQKGAVSGVSYDVPIQPGDSLVIKGLDLQVSLTKTNAPALRINGLDNSSREGSYRVERKGSQILVSMIEFGSKREWKDVLSQKSQKRKVIEIQGPSIPVEIYARDGQVTLTQWQQRAEVHLVNGKIFSNQGRDLELTIQKGEATVTEQQGRLKADVNQGQLNFKNSNSEADIRIQSGQTHLEKTRGRWNVSSQAANVKIVQSQGVLQVDNQKGQWTVSQFQGRIDGQMGDGNLTMSVLNESDVNLKSVSGKMQIQIPQGSGAFLNLLSADGDLFLPGDLKANRGGSEKSYRGRLRGESQKVSVTARSQDGLIVLKY